MLTVQLRDTQWYAMLPVQLRDTQWYALLPIKWSDTQWYIMLPMKLRHNGMPCYGAKWGFGLPLASTPTRKRHGFGHFFCCKELQGNNPSLLTKDRKNGLRMQLFDSDLFFSNAKHLAYRLKVNTLR
ncbi:hypothetical protein CEXT_784281 [Caerostris extrusa]|uniref:Uncharacterized protein n=1 Tax=Caerostris extrusa TaxID=172846 RepID=A0AAV4MLD5_CAEEX|nr:hypothetical protein CEXT_784281 [Caerostris extrusa]